MKIKLVSKNTDDIAPLLLRYGLEPAAGTPELVVAHGGDGTLLIAEREFPGIPKLPIRDAGTAPLCEEHQYEKQLEAFRDGRLKLTELPKLAGSAEGETLLGINDIFIHNFDRSSALRYRVWINDELYANEVVGDGVGISSVHGSTAYYRSITHSIFRVGLGLAFSNSTEEVNHLVIPADASVRIGIVRGPGLIIADNDRHTITVPAGSEVLLRQSSEIARIYGLQEFMCQKCRLLRHPDKSPYKRYIGL